MREHKSEVQNLSSVRQHGPLTNIAGIFLQEMLHLTLTGNILSALGGSMDLYHPDVIPKFPGKVLYEEVDVILDRANKKCLERFQKVSTRALMLGQALTPLPITDRGAIRTRV